jgi:arylsulfatase A-like enzyme
MSFVPTRYLAVAVLASSAASTSCTRAPEPPPDVVLVTLDTLRADHVGCYGYPRDTTPFLDRMAREGVRFENAIAASSHTAPSHASIFTSRLPLHHGVVKNGQRLREEIPSMASLLREAGYETAAFTSVRFLNGLKSGFDLFKPGHHTDTAREVLGRARSWLGTRRASPRSELPLFLWIHLYDPHQPYVAGETEYGRQLAASTAEEKEAFLAYLAKEHGLTNHLPQAAEARRMDPKELILRQVDGYDADIRLADDALADFYGAMEKNGLNDDVLWIFTSDHGEGLGNHGLYTHDRHVYQEQLRIPLIVHDTRRRLAERSVDSLVGHVDLLPTVLEWTSVYLPELEGSSLVPLLLGEGMPSRLAYSQRRSPVSSPSWVKESVFAVQSRELKYIYHEASEDELFDLERDPFELSNLVRERPELAQDLKTALETHLASVEESDRPEPVADADGHGEELSALGYVVE